MSIQEDHYGGEYDYWSGSPHLRHRHLHEALMERISSVVDGVEGDRPHSVVEVGAGDGAITERLLAMGCRVTATDMSAESVFAMDAKFKGNDRFRGVHDPDGDLAPLGDLQFDLILYSSVLHHIPDYLAHLRDSTSRHLGEGGALVAIQDPLWYPRLPGKVLKLTRASYLTWRLGQGDLTRGFRTRLRRMTSGLSEEAPGDAVEYHVVRNGVDEEAIRQFASEHFEVTEIDKYWSSQGPSQQRLGERLGYVNTFAVFATGYQG